MKFRQVTIFSGQQFSVPQGIQRIDHRATHGWQLRYGGTKLFSDHSADGSAAAASLALAAKELQKRIAKLPAPVRLQRAPSGNKSSDLPPGIFGPVVRQRSGSRVRDASLSVLVPRFGKAPLRRTIYIGTENTYTPERFQQALAKAVELREKAVAAYETATTRAMRAAGRELKASMAEPPARSPTRAAAGGRGSARTSAARA